MSTETFWITVFITSALLSTIVAWAAGQRGRSAAAWFILSLLISPILALLALLVAGPAKTRGKAGTTAAADLSNLSDEDVATLQAHRTRQNQNRVNLPQKLE